MSISDLNALYDSVNDINPDLIFDGYNYYIKNYGSSLLLSVSDSILSAQPDTTTRWYVTPVSTNVYKISSMETPSKFLTSMGNGKSLQLLESNTTSTLHTNGNNVIQSVFTNANIEKWFITTQIAETI